MNKIIPLLGLVAFTSLSAQAENLLLNGDFNGMTLSENGIAYHSELASSQGVGNEDLLYWDNNIDPVTNSIADWTTSGPFQPGKEIADGNNVYGVHDSGSISQLFQIAEAGEHTFSIDTFAYSYQSSGVIDIVIETSNNETIFSQTINEAGDGVKTVSTYKFDAVATGDYEVKITGGNLSRGVMIDNVSIEATVVPEPSSSLLILLGSASVLIRRRR